VASPGACTPYGEYSRGAVCNRHALGILACWLQDSDSRMLHSFCECSLPASLFSAVNQRLAHLDSVDCSFFSAFDTDARCLAHHRNSSVLSSPPSPLLSLVPICQARLDRTVTRLPCALQSSLHCPACCTPPVHWATHRIPPLDITTAWGAVSTVQCQENTAGPSPFLRLVLLPPDLIIMHGLKVQIPFVALEFGVSEKNRMTEANRSVIIGPLRDPQRASWHVNTELEVYHSSPPLVRVRRS